MQVLLLDIQLRIQYCMGIYIYTDNLRNLHIVQKVDGFLPSLYSQGFCLYMYLYTYINGIWKLVAWYRHLRFSQD
jgi:hypothetical protein